MVLPEVFTIHLEHINSFVIIESKVNVTLKCLLAGRKFCMSCNNLMFLVNSDTSMFTHVQLILLLLGLGGGGGGGGGGGTLISEW